MVSDLPSLRTAWGFFGLWGSLAILVFAVAAYLTERVFEVQEESPLQKIGIFSRNGGAVTPSVAFEYHRIPKRAWMQLDLVSGILPAKVFLNNVNPQDCTFSAASVKSGPAKLIPFRSGGYIFDWESESGGGTLACHLDPAIVLSNTFSKRSVEFENSSESFLKTEDWRSGAAVKWTLVASSLYEDTDSIGIMRTDYSTVGNNFQNSEAVRDVLPEEDVVLRWESRSRESQRDVMLVIIGSLVALGAAMFLEALRPFVDRFIGRHQLSSPRTSD